MTCLPDYTKSEISKLYNLLPIPLIVVNEDDIVMCNKHFLNLVGYTLQEIKQMDYRMIADANEQIDFKETIKMLLYDCDVDLSYNMKLKTKDHHIIWVKYSIGKFIVDGKKALLITFNDITKEKNSEMKLAKYVLIRQSMLELTHSMISANSLESIYDIILEVAINSIEGASVGSVMLREENELEIVAGRGFGGDNLIGARIPINESFIYRACNGNMTKTVIIDDIKELSGIEFIEGSDENFVQSTISAPIYVDDEFFGLVNVDSVKTSQFDDDDRITMDFIRTNIALGIKQHLLINERVYLSRYDGLTKLYNRSQFERMTIDFINNPSCSKEKVFIVMIDVDDLKMVNDSYGHIAGDKMLVQFSEYYRKLRTNNDLLGRYGGDEFIGLFIREDYMHLVSELEDFRRNIPPVEISEEIEVDISFSYGVSCYYKDSTQYRQLVRIADSKMYEYKMNNKGNKR